MEGSRSRVNSQARAIRSERFFATLARLSQGLIPDLNGALRHHTSRMKLSAEFLNLYSLATIRRLARPAGG